jgi:hypothetical protein
MNHAEKPSQGTCSRTHKIQDQITPAGCGAMVVLWFPERTWKDYRGLAQAAASSHWPRFNNAVIAQNSRLEGAWLISSKSDFSD